MIISWQQIHKKSPIWHTCIVGSGPAGLSLALTLSQKGEKILLIEGGGFKPKQSSNDLNKGSGQLTCNNKKYPMTDWFKTSRFRGFGGGSQIWDGHISQFTEDVFENWPIKLNDLKVYYKKALGILKTPAELSSIKKDENTFLQSYIQNGKKLGDEFREYIKKSKNIDLIIDLNASEIFLDKVAKKVTILICKKHNGTQVKVPVNNLVLATGTVENTRILLQNKHVLKPVMGKSFDWVGKNFSEHIQLYSGEILTQHEKLFRKENTDPLHSSKFSVLNRKGILWHFVPAITKSSSVLDRAVKKLNINQLNPDKRLSIFMALEHSPDKTSSITLAKEVDALGNNLPKLNWNINHQQLQYWESKIRAMAKAAFKFNFGRSKVNLTKNNVIETAIKSWGSLNAHHPSGTTRMSENAADGVVDSYGKVHGLNNLFIAGASVFPTAGATNPTLTIMALSIRLGDFLARKKS